MKCYYLAAACAAACIVAQPAAAQTKVTEFADETNTTPKVWFTNDVRPGGSAGIADLTGLGGNLENNQPLPVGAALLTTDFTNDAKGEAGVLDDYGSPNDIFASLNLSYWYNKASNAGQNLSAAPSLKLAFYNPSCPQGVDCYVELVYEPTWNQANPGTSQPPPLDTWTQVTIDANNGLFWNTGGFGQASTPGGPADRTLAEWLAAFNDDFGTASLFRVSIGVGTYNQGQIGYFDDVSISHSAYSESYDFDVKGPALATFNVTSTFSDGNPAATEVTLDCNGGLPLQQTYTLAGGASVGFVVKDFVEGETRCTVTQAGAPAGYTMSFFDGAAASPDGCVFENITSDEYSCAVTGALEVVEFQVKVDYEISPGASGLNSEITFDWYCESFRESPAGSLTGSTGSFTLDEGDTVETFDFWPNYTTPESRCRFEVVSANSAVETDEGCADWTYMHPGDEQVSCTVTATLFFEGIPAVDQRGLAVLALLMLAVGFYGFRRLV